MYMTVCEQQGTFVSYNMLNPCSNPNRITYKIEFKVGL